MTKANLHKEMKEIYTMLQNFVEVLEAYHDPLSTEEDIANIREKSFNNSIHRIHDKLEKIEHRAYQQRIRNREKRDRDANERTHHETSIHSLSQT